MEKFIQSDIKEQAIKKGIWLSGLNSFFPILLVSVVSLVLAGIAIANYCSIACQ